MSSEHFDRDDLERRLAHQRQTRISAVKRWNRPLTESELRYAHLWDLSAHCSDMRCKSHSALEHPLPESLAAQIKAAMETMRTLKAAIEAEMQKSLPAQEGSR